MESKTIFLCEMSDSVRKENRPFLRACSDDRPKTQKRHSYKAVAPLSQLHKVTVTVWAHKARIASTGDIALISNSTEGGRRGLLVYFSN